MCVCLHVKRGYVILYKLQSFLLSPLVAGEGHPGRESGLDFDL